MYILSIHKTKHGSRNPKPERSTFALHQGVLEGGQLLLAQLDLVGDLPRVHDQLGFHVDEVVVVGVLLDREGLLQDLGDDRPPPVDVVLELFGFVQLFQQSIPLGFEDFL